MVLPRCGVLLVGDFDLHFLPGGLVYLLYPLLLSGFSPVRSVYLGNEWRL